MSSGPEDVCRSISVAGYQQSLRWDRSGDGWDELFSRDKDIPSVVSKGERPRALWQYPPCALRPRRLHRYRSRT